jgi:cysteine desulfurase
MKKMKLSQVVYFFFLFFATLHSSIYLDYQATTPVDPRVLESMLPFFTKIFGNPHSTSHAYGKQANQAVESARAKIAAVINADTEEVIFTSGATEANNLAILGICRNLKKSGKNEIISVVTEHKSVLEPLKVLEKEGFKVILLPVQPSGIIKIEDLQKALSPRTALVTIMAANNEIGVLQPIKIIAKLAHQSGALFHTDAAQAFGKIVIDVKDSDIDLLSISGHKVYGPKGIGALFIRKGLTLTPLVYGGGQEKEIRPGTLPVPLCVGLGKAAELAQQEFVSESRRLLSLRTKLLTLLQQQLPSLTVNGDLEERLPGNLNFSVKNIDGKSLLEQLQGIAISFGSACASKRDRELSYVIEALRGKPIVPTVAIRISLGRFTTENDIEKAAEELIAAIKNSQGRKIA